MEVFKKISYYWNNHRFESILILSLIIFIILFIFDRKYEYHYQSFEVGERLSKKRQPIPMKNEQRCRKILENYFQVPFNKARPDFLRYKNGKNLELDGYNPDLNMAFEYNGEAHYKYNKFFHNSYQDFIDQQERDKFKYQKCREMGIRLLIIPNTVKYENLEKYIKSQIVSM